MIRLLQGGVAMVAEAAKPGKLLMRSRDRGTIAVERTLLAEMVAEGIVTVRGSTVRLAHHPAQDAPRDIADQHRDIEVMFIDAGSGPNPVAVNTAESPLGQLMRRKAKDGSPFLRSEEFSAGERLRADFTRGQLMPRLGANWVASVASGRRHGGAADLTDSALAARQRVERALAAVGPELSGVLVDVCCFLKGLETVEIERNWPVRSAKLMLKAALGTLARHYNPSRDTATKSAGYPLHWGSPDYRPTIA